MSGKLLVGLSLMTLGAYLAFGTDALAPAAVLFYVLMPLRYRVVLLVLSALLPLGPGFTIAGLRVALSELLAPLMFLESILTPRMRTAGPKWTRTTILVIWGIFLIIVALALSYVRNPAGTANLFGGVGQGYGIRAYYQALMCIFTFFVVFRAVTSEVLDGMELVSTVAWVCVAVGVLRIANYVGAIPVVPFFEGNLRYMSFEGGFNAALEVTKRVGGLDQAGGYGLLAAYACWVMTHRKRMLVLAVVSALVTIYGGGRSAFVGASLAILIDMASGGVRRVARALPVIAAAYLILTTLKIHGETVASPQFRRLAQIVTGTRQLESDAYRLEGFEALFAQWKENPILGSGIAAPQRGQTATISGFGGHGAVISLVGLFGMMGVGFLLLFVIVPLLAGMRQLIRNRPLRTESSAMIMRLASLLLVFEVVGMLAGGNGYGDSHLYASVALLAGAETLVCSPLRRVESRPPAGRGALAGCPAG